MSEKPGLPWTHDRVPPDRRTLLQRTAEPYIGSDSAARLGRAARQLLHYQQTFVTTIKPPHSGRCWRRQVAFGFNARGHRLLSIREGHLLPIREGHLRPIREGRRRPTREGRLRPIREGRLLPIREGHLRPVREGRLRPDWV